MARRRGGGVSIEMTDNFNFQLIGGELAPFAGYVSSLDPTMASPRVMIKGSQNVYKKLSGTIAWREGLKLRGAVDATIAGVKSSVEFNCLGNIRPIRVCNSKMQVEMDTTGAGNYVWTDLLTGLGSNTRFVFDSWWDDSNKKDVMLAVNGTGVTYAWSGGAGVITSATTNTIVLAGTQTLAQMGFDGSGTVVIAGTEYVYTGAGVSSNQVVSYTATNNTPALSNTTWHSQSFTTSASSTQILNVTCKVKSLAVSTVNALFTGMIYSDNAGVPGTQLVAAQASIAHDFSTGDFTLTFTFNYIDLPNTTYHFVVRNDSGGSFDIYTGNSGAVGTNTSTDSGATWSTENGHLYCTVNENVVSPQTLVGVTPDPSALSSSKDVVVQKVKQWQNVPATGFANDFLKVVNNQVHIGSYNSRLIYVSSNTDYTNFTVPDVRVTGDPDLLTLDSAVRGVAAQKGNTTTAVTVISGSEGDWYSVVRSDITVGTTLTESVQVVKADSADLESAKAHEFIGNIGDSIVFLDDGNQLRQYGTVRNIITPVFPEHSLDVHDELADTDFTGGHLRAVGNIIYITAPLTGVDYMYQIWQKIDTVGNLSSERLWQPPQIRNVSRIVLINGVTYGHSNANPQLYQMVGTNQYHDDSPSGESLPYRSVMRMAYRNAESIGGQRAQFLKFDKEFVEGYIVPGSAINGKIYFDYQGSTTTGDIVINSDDLPVSTFSGINAPSLGDKSLGDDPLGDGVVNDPSQQALLPKFRTIIGVSDNNDIFEYSLEISSETADARCEIICLGVNAQLSPEHPTDIMQ